MTVRTDYDPADEPGGGRVTNKFYAIDALEHAQAINAKPDDLSDLGVTASATELNYVDGVTSAIQSQLDAKQTLDSDLTAFASKTAPTGAVVGTTDTQTLTDKSMSGSSNTFTNISADSTVDGTTNKAFTATMSTKLAGIASGATANSSDATLLARANHTGTQTASTISDFSTAADARITAASLVHLAGAETITGLKTFSGGIAMDDTLDMNGQVIVRLAQIYDENFNLALEIGAPGGTIVNHFQVIGSTTGVNPSVSVVGETNAGLNFNLNGTGRLTANGVNIPTISSTDTLTNKTIGADQIVDGTTNKAYTATEKTKLAGIAGTNTGDQTSIVGISGTTAQFNTALSDNDFATLAGTETLTNKRVQPRVVAPSVASTYTIDLTATDLYVIGTQNAAITNLTTTGTAVDGQLVMIRIKGDGTGRAITWDSTKIVSSGIATLLASTAASKTHHVGLIYDGTLGKMVCVAVDPAGY